MEYRSSYERINNIEDIESISKLVCEKYKLGKYVSYTIMDIGYEDFNYVLQTTNEKYFVKIFNTDRDMESCERLINILKKSLENNINVPKLYKTNDSYMYSFTINNVELSLFVMEYIDGDNLYLLDRDLTLEEIENVAQIASKINTTDYDIKETFYDEWTLSNLKTEYEKKKAYLSDEDKSNIEEILMEFEKIDFSKFKHCYIHGDIIKANLILDKNKKIYIIDFSVFNFLPRIIEVTAILLGDCLTDNRETTMERMNCFLKSYHQKNKLDEIEIKNLPLIMKSLAAMFIIQSSYIKSTSGDYSENEYWLSEGRKAIRMNITNEELAI